MKVLALGAMLGGILVAAPYEITRSTIDGGGIMHGTGGLFELSGTIGQPDVGTMAGGTFELTGGFWFALAAGDCNEDGAVGLSDHSALQTCLTGPAAPVDSDCRCLDIDSSGTVDLVDFAAFQNLIED